MAHVSSVSHKWHTWYSLSQYKCVCVTITPLLVASYPIGKLVTTVTIMPLMAQLVTQTPHNPYPITGINLHTVFIRIVATATINFSLCLGMVTNRGQLLFEGSLY